MAYSTAAEVMAFTRHLLNGQVSFNSTTRPTSTEVTQFIARASGVLDVALAAVGISTPITEATAKLACDDWVTARAAEYVELTQRGTGFSDAEGSRTAAFRNLHKMANDFAAANRKGFIYLGVSVANATSDGLAFTGLDAQNLRSDPDDSTLAQPIFYRGLYDDPQGSGYSSGPDDTEFEDND